MRDRQLLSIVHKHDNYRSMTSSLLSCALLSLLLVEQSCSAFITSGVSLRQSSTAYISQLHASDADSQDNKVDVSDLGLSMEDLEAPLPEALLQGISMQGVQSTSCIPDVQDDGCLWTENADTLEVTLVIPGLRGQPAACLAVRFATTTVTISAFGRSVFWSCLLRGQINPNDCSFSVEDGADMVPIVQMVAKKAEPKQRWGGFIDQIGEDSIL